jgi:Fe-S cluster assembly iron-binding protein IscA
MNNNFESISKIFTTNDQAEMKQAFKELLIKRFEDDLNQFDEYLFDPRKIESWINDMFLEVINEVKIEFKKNLQEQMLKLFENGNIEQLFLLKKDK